MRSPGHPTYPFVPRSQIKHSYGLAISSARDNLDCRWIETIFITILVRNAIGNTRACRVETFSTPADDVMLIRVKHREESRCGTHECVRYGSMRGRLPGRRRTFARESGIPQRQP